MTTDRAATGQALLGTVSAALVFGLVVVGLLLTPNAQAAWRMARRRPPEVA